MKFETLEGSFSAVSTLSFKSARLTFVHIAQNQLLDKMSSNRFCARGFEEIRNAHGIFCKFRNLMIHVSNYSFFLPVLMRFSLMFFFVFQYIYIFFWFLIDCHRILIDFHYLFLRFSAVGFSIFFVTRAAQTERVFV